MKVSLLISSEWAWQTVLFVCLFFQVDAVTILLSNIMPVPCSHNSVKTKAVVEIFPLFFDSCCWQRCKWEHSVMWKHSLESFTPMTCLSQKKVQVALVTLYTKVIFAWMYSLIREQKWICIFIKGLHFLRVGEFDELEVILFRSLSLKQINEHGSEQRNTLLCYINAPLNVT